MLAIMIFREVPYLLAIIVYISFVSFCIFSALYESLKYQSEERRDTLLQEYLAWPTTQDFQSVNEICEWILASKRIFRSEYSTVPWIRLYAFDAEKVISETVAKWTVNGEGELNEENFIQIQKFLADSHNLPVFPNIYDIHGNFIYECIKRIPFEKHQEVSFVLSYCSALKPSL
ncbi:MAG: hypothetical protein PHH16_00075 [Candidatus Gracilibacteria bacterium]|nr:hypothetical protein [Candidatus Gracilibacteria bacterium]